MLLPSLLLALSLAPLQETSFEERLLATIPEGIDLAPEPARQLGVEVRTTRGAGFDSGDSNHVAWTPDGGTVAYVGVRGDRFVPVIGDEVGDDYRDVFAPHVGPTAEHIAFRCLEGEFKDVRWMLRVGSEVCADHRWIGAPAWSPDGKRLAYWCEPDEVRRLDAIERGSDRVLVVDVRGEVEEISDECERIEQLTWGPDGLLAWAERRDDGWWVVAGSSEAGPYTEVDALQFDAEGARLAYGARSGRELWWRVLSLEDQ